MVRFVIIFGQGKDSAEKEIFIVKFVYTVDSLITHTPQWTAQGMGFQGVWASRSGQTKAKQIKYYVKIQKRVRKQTHYMLLLFTIPKSSMVSSLALPHTDISADIS